MKKFIRYTLIFLASLCVLDWAFGQANRTLERLAHTSNYHCCYEADEDILVLGSSFAVKEVIPSILTNSLHLSCYNAGEAGNGILCAWVRYNMFIRQHTPRLILYALTPGYDYVDMGNGDDYNEYLNSFKAYYGIEPAVDSVYAVLGEKEDALRLRSAFFRYNSAWLVTLGYAISPRDTSLHGYIPIYGEYIPHTVPDSTEKRTIVIDEKKMAYFESLMRDASSRGIKVICFHTPHYYDAKSTHHQSLERVFYICKELGIPIIDNSDDSYYKDKPELFGDKAHLNHKGAQIYTAQLCDSIRSYLQNY